MSSEATYVGCDVSKALLQLDGPCRQSRGKIANQSSVIRRELLRLKTLYPRVHLVCEPTGAYERVLMAVAIDCAIPLTRVDAFKVRHFALGLGWLEKSDPIDAELLRRYAEVAQPKPTARTSVEQDQLRDWVQLRDHYVQQLGHERAFLESVAQPKIRTRVEARCKELEALIDEIDAELAQFLEEAPELQAKVQTLCLVDSVGFRIATGLLAYMPELGLYPDRKLAKLAGVAPIVDDSGERAGNKHIARGRGRVRRLLYQAALVALRHNEYLRPFYRRLRDKGKPAKVALIATARKLLTFLNSLLKPAAYQPA